MSIPIILDCDPGHDDAIALLLALASPEVDLLGVTTVAGNSTLDKTTDERPQGPRTERPAARFPSPPGLRDPWCGIWWWPHHVHGKSGLDGPDLADPAIRPVAIHAVDFLAETDPRFGGAGDAGRGWAPDQHRAPAEPLSGGLRQGRAGSFRWAAPSGLGNITPAAEFNIYVDPEAAHRVYHSGVPITMIGLDVTHQACSIRTHAERLRPMGRAGRFVAELLDFFIGNYPRHRSGGAGEPRSMTRLRSPAVIWPDLVSTVDCHVTVDTQSELCRGRTVVDRWHVTGQASERRGRRCPCPASALPNF